MIREKVKVEDYRHIGKEYKHYIWHFIQKDQNRTRLSFFSYFDEKDFRDRPNPLILFIDTLNLPYFESYTEDSIEFLMNCNIHGSRLFQPVYDPYEFIYRRQFFPPIFSCFNNYNMVSNTLNYCYCAEGFVDVIKDLDIKYILEMESKLF